MCREPRCGAGRPRRGESSRDGGWNEVELTEEAVLDLGGEGEHGADVWKGVEGPATATGGLGGHGGDGMAGSRHLCGRRQCCTCGSEQTGSWVKG